ncbi:hypothetical protein C8R44DRAFT_866634 [Mycena epipterygia]|nr:hypothetical protein C8R44DRAFT_866634 [Mycena epipterygia]
MLRGSQVTSFTIESGSDLPLGELPLQLNRLTVLSITASPWSFWSVDSEIILQAISRCPELRSCRLLVSSGLDNEMWSPKPIVELPFLHTLEIHCVGGVASTFTRLLKRLALPELRNFNLHGNTGEVIQEEENIPSLTPFFALSMHLKNVQVEASIFLKSSFLEFLRSLPPTIQHLQIDDESLWASSQTFDDDALVAITPTAGLPAPCCPALRNLVITHCRLVSDAAVLRFITVRMADTPRTTLRRVEVHFNRTRNLDIMPNIRPFIEIGLNVSITHIMPGPEQFLPWAGDEPREGIFHD